MKAWERIPAAKMSELFAEGYTCEEVAAFFGVSASTIRNAMRASGIRDPYAERRSKKRDALLAEIRRLHAEGMTDIAMSAVLGTAAKNVRCARGSIGLKPNKPPKAPPPVKPVARRTPADGVALTPAERRELGRHLAATVAHGWAPGELVRRRA